MLKKNQLNLVHGFQSFPTKFLDTDVSRISILKKIFKKQVCYADHSDSENLGICYSLCSLAIINGASIIEKHITLDRSKKETDYYSSLNPNEFKKMVSLIRQTEISLGSSQPTFSKEELQYRMNHRKNPILKSSIKKGTVLHEKLFVI